VELRDGFIVGIFNYCDRWCEACAFTSRCRVFATLAEMEASFDPGLRELTRADRLGAGGPTGAAVHAFPDLALADDSDLATGEEVEHRALPDDLAALAAAAERYRERVWAWLKAERGRFRDDPEDPLAVVVRGHAMIGAKLAGAFAFAELGLPEEADDESDSDGRVKAALLAIDRSHVAWLSLVESKAVTAELGFMFIEDLVGLGRDLEARFPQARAFVRPGFDEPDAVAAMERT
jgi:hypothetical protein